MPGRSKKAFLKACGQLHVIVTCSDRKTRQIDPQFCIRSLSGKRLDARIAQWTRVLQGPHGVPPVPAGELYSGDQWNVARSIPRLAEREDFEVKLWICSAGYGLLSPESPVQPYNATFSTGLLDSVASTNEFDVGDWWRCLTRWRPLGHAGPRSLRDLAKQLAARKDGFMLVAVSKPYLDAIESDLREAIGVGGMSDRIAVISVGGHAGIREAADDQSAGLRRALIPADARLKRRVGGAMQSVNVRLARHAVESRARWFPDLSKLVRQFTVLCEATPALGVHKRERLTDDAILSEIGRLRRRGTAVTASSALRTLRDSGLACEQSRFSRLFRDHVAAERRSARLKAKGGGHR